MKIKRSLIAAVFAFFAIFGCRESLGVDESKTVEESIKEKVNYDPSLDYKQEVQNFKLEGFSKTGENQWSVKGQFANILDPDVVLKSIEGKSLSKDTSVTLTAERGIYNKNTRSAELKGNVVAVMSDGGKVYMDYALWNADDEQITTESPIRIEHSGIVLEGLGGMVKPQKEWAIIYKHIRMCDEKERVITCDGPLEVDYKAKQAILNNNVVIIDPQQGKISSDKVIAYFNTETKEIDRVEWLGNVKAVY